MNCNATEKCCFFCSSQNTWRKNIENCIETCDIMANRKLAYIVSSIRVDVSLARSREPHQPGNVSLFSFFFLLVAHTLDTARLIVEKYTHHVCRHVKIKWHMTHRIEFCVAPKMGLLNVIYVIVYMNWVWTCVSFSKALYALAVTQRNDNNIRYIAYTWFGFLHCKYESRFRTWWHRSYQKLRTKKM